MEQKTRKKIIAKTFVALSTVMVIHAAHAAPSNILDSTCDAYAENWAGLRMHYDKGRNEFDAECEFGTDGKELMEGLWAVRALVPDGHAGFSVKQKKPKPYVYPVILDYDPVAKELFIAAVLKDSYSKYLGKRIKFINGKPAIDVLAQRAAIEPQSTAEASLALAARTILFQPHDKIYSEFPIKLKFTFKNGRNKGFRKVPLESALKKNNYVLNRNGYPSIWGNIWNIEDGSLCKTENEISKVFYYKNQKWLLWHPRSMAFDVSDLNFSFKCWLNEMKNIDGVIVDLRDTAGGGYEQVVTIADMLNAGNRLTMKYRTAENNKTEAMTIKTESNDLPKWNGKIIMLTNGLCGSGCETLASLLSKRKDVCSYGTRTAGRRMGADEFKIDDQVTVEISTRNYLDSKGKSLEGQAVAPQHIGIGDFKDALNICLTD